MAFIHYLFLGHFDHTDKILRFEKRPGDRVYKPVVSRPIEMGEAKAVFQEVRGGDDSPFPPDWLASEEDNYLICEKYTRNREVVEFVSLLVERTGCSIYDVAAHGEILLPEWLAAIREYSRPSVSPLAGGSRDAAAAGPG